MLKDLKYADTHEWVKVEGDSAIVGITDHAQVHMFDTFNPSEQISVLLDLPCVGLFNACI